LIRLNFRVDGERQVSALIAVTGERANDLRPAFRRMGDDFFGRYMPKVFATQGDAAETPTWPSEPASYSAAYAAYKTRRTGSTSPALVLTGKLRRAFVSAHGPGTINVTSAQNFAFGVSGAEFPGALVHQRGRFTGLMSRRKIAQRKIINVSRDLERRWVRTIQRWIVTGKL